MAKLDVQATFTLDTSSYPPAPLWLALSVSTSDGVPVSLVFPNPAYPGRSWPVKAVVLTSEGFGGVPVPVQFTGVIYESLFDFPGIYVLDIDTGGDFTAPLAEIRPLSIAVVVESGTDRGQTLARASQSMRIDTDDR
jgi:hypothetical protein